ncbi:hypothetical protein L1785_11400 [Antribacter sp. KLBMP9083]|uniref:Uncharacterized protein n=1 Tax=Antribacter soli TaxID=2910976 RepID=A0AA41U705_9MICO|nr:hypothetical protein [Antribacter soli]MCF4121588.1 hypothetical protein [Antribacter soli]
MNIPVGWSILLLITAVWNLLIWPRFWRRVASDPRARDEAGGVTPFLQVHAGLIGVSLALAVAVGVLGVLGLVG